MKEWRGSVAGRERESSATRWEFRDGNLEGYRVLIEGRLLSGSVEECGSREGTVTTMQIQWMRTTPGCLCCFPIGCNL